MKRRIFLFGCLGSVVLIFVLAAITVAASRGPYELARSRWDEKGSPDYTLIVSQYCFCGLVGEYKITVQSGRVTAFEEVGAAGSGSTGIVTNLQPANFDRMTVAAMLGQALRDQSDAWTVPWTHQLNIVYDPTYGYVTGYSSDLNGKLSIMMGQMIMDSGYSYAAHDLVISQP